LLSICSQRSLSSSGIFKMFIRYGSSCCRARPYFFCVCLIASLEAVSSCRNILIQGVLRCVSAAKIACSCNVRISLPVL
jgi:hypothetical protein